jgi:hypothetical protein
LPELDLAQLFEQAGDMFRHTYNERITDVETSEHGLPTAWTWRGRRYASQGLIERWVSTRDWWRDLEALAPDRPESIQHFDVPRVGWSRLGWPSCRMGVRVEHLVLDGRAHF